MQINGHIVRLPPIGFQQHATSQGLALLNENRHGKQASNLIPVRQWRCWRRGQPDMLTASAEFHIEPKGQTVADASLQYVKLERNI